MTSHQSIIPWELSTCPITKLPILTKPEWKNLHFDTKDYKITYSVIGKNIIHVKTWGYTRLYTTAKYIEFLTNTINAVIPENEKYILLENYKDNKGATLGSKNKYIEFHKNNDRLKALIFYDTSPFFNILIKMAKRIVPTNIPFETVDDYATAILLAQDKNFLSHNSAYNLNDIKKKSQPFSKVPEKPALTKLISKEDAKIKNYVNELLEFMESISWDHEGTSIEKLNIEVSHPFKPIYDSIVFIKDDFDRIITEKNNAEKSIIEQNKFNQLRADIWKIASNKSLSVEELIQRLLNKIGPAMGVSRVCYNQPVDPQNKESAIVCTLEWTDTGVIPTVGDVIPYDILKHFVVKDFFAVNLESAVQAVPAIARPVVRPLLKKIFDSQNLESSAVLPYYVDNTLRGWFTFDICIDNPHKPHISNEMRIIANEILNILTTFIKQKNAEDKLRTAYNEMEEKVIERTKELKLSHENLQNSFDELMRSQKELQQSEERFRQLAENAPIGIYYSDFLGTFLYGNKKAEELIGYTREELINKSFMQLNLLDKDDYVKAGKLLLTNSIGRPTGPDEFTLIRKDGQKRIVEIVTSIVQLGDNKVILGMVQDIHDRKHAENKLMENTKKLEETNRALAKTHEELNNLNLSLENKIQLRTSEVRKLLDQKDAFINQLGHDLRNPLTPLLSLTPIILAEEKDPKLKKMLEIVMKDITNIKNLVFKTLEIARLSSPFALLEVNRISLYELVNGIIDSKAHLFHKYSVIIENSIPSDMIVMIDRLRIMEVFDHLIDNALKFSNTNKQLRFSAKKNAHDIVVSVADNGIGLEESQIKLIFDEFYKADPARHDMASSGLGLSICKRIVEKHNGTIWAESAGKDKGTTISFSLKAM